MRRAALTAILVLGVPRFGAAQTNCPDSAAMIREIGSDVEIAYAAWKKAPTGPVPAACLYSAVARAPLMQSDSVILKALELSAQALGRSPDNPEILTARLVMLSRARRYAEVAPTMDELFVARPTATTQEMHRLTIGAVMQLHDTAAILSRLENAATRFGSSPTFAPEFAVWRQIPRLRALIDTVHRIMKKDPTLVAGLVNLSSIYGNLDQPDSAIHYAKRALRAGNSRDAVAKALESLIGVKLRRAQLIGVPELWVATLPVALAIDSTLSTPASKYLIARTLSEIVADETRLAQYISSSLDSGDPAGYARVQTAVGGNTYLRVMSCSRLTELNAMIVTARAKLAEGGDHFAVETIPRLRGGLAAMEASLAQLKPRCTGA